MLRRDVDDLDRTPGRRREQHDAIGQTHRLIEVMRDEDDRRARLPPGGEQVTLHDAARLVIEAAEGLVHEQEPGCQHQGAREGYPLAHPTAELARHPVGKGGEPDSFELFDGTAPGFTLREPAVAQTEGDVVAHRQPIKEVVLLKDQDRVATRTDDVLSVHRDGAASRVLQARDQL